jgi:PAS domain S-box-containing protein
MAVDDPEKPVPPRTTPTTEPLERGDARGRTRPDALTDAQHHKLLKTGLSFRMMLGGIDEYAIFALDRDGNVLSWNDGAERIKGYLAQEIIGQHVSRFYTDEDLEHDRPAALLKTAESQGHVTDEGWRVRKDGTVFWADINITALRDDTGVLKGFCKVTRDATRRKRAEDALAELSTRLLEAEDSERRRIALELNDKTSPNFTSLLLKLRQLRKRTEKLGGDTLQLVGDSLLLADSLSREIRVVSYFLNPPLLDAGGLLASLRWYLDGFSKHRGIVVDVEFPEQLDRLPRPTERALYRVTQECFTSIVGRSGSSRANVRLSTEGELLILEIRNERGNLSPSVLESLREGKGELAFTIAGMRELMKQLGGRLNVTSSDRGTSVTAIVPIGASARDAAKTIVHDDRSRDRIAKEIPVSLASLSDTGARETGQSENLSSHGMRVTTEHAWRTGDQARVSSSEAGLSAEARVVYCEFLGDRFAVGLELFKPAEDLAPRG